MQSTDSPEIRVLVALADVQAAERVYDFSFACCKFLTPQTCIETRPVFMTLIAQNKRTARLEDAHFAERSYAATQTEKPGQVRHRRVTDLAT